MFYKEIYLTELYFIILFHLSAEELGIKELVPPYLDPHLQPQDLKTGICFASGGTGYIWSIDSQISGTFNFEQFFFGFKFYRTI